MSLRVILYVILTMTALTVVQSCSSSDDKMPGPVQPDLPPNDNSNENDSNIPHHDDGNGHEGQSGGDNGPEGQNDGELDCTKWNISNLEGYQKLAALNIQLEVDCNKIKNQIHVNLIKSYRDDIIPRTIADLGNQSSKINTLPVKPTKILLTTYSMRGFDTGVWRVNLTSEDNRGVYFVEREAALQPIERDLFQNKIFLTTGTQSSYADYDTVFSETHKSEMDIAAKNLKVLQAKLLTKKDYIKYISLPLFTSQDDEFLTINYNSKYKVLQLPYKISEERIADFLDKIIAEQAALQASLGEVTLNIDIDDFTPNMWLSSYFRDRENTKTSGITSVYKTALTKLRSISGNLAQVVKKHRILQINFSKISENYSDPAHVITNETMTFIVARDGITQSIYLFKSDAANDCLEKLISHIDYRYDPICTAKFE